jgi:Mg2+ and Co2+ transporter CorA
MLTQCERIVRPCVIYGIDVTSDGQFKPREQGLYRVEVSEEKENEFWSKLQEEVRKNIRVRVLFVDNLSKSVLKMLGTKYNIEPFFFSSSTNWIPSRYREEVRHGVGDHITVILPFIRTTEKKQKAHPSLPELNERKHNIDVTTPLNLHGEHVLLIDLLAVHMIREKNSSTIITYHPPLHDRTTAGRLCQVMERAGGSLYWNKIFMASEDPTFFFLVILWYALYAWDETFEVLYNRIKDLEVILNASDFAAMADLNHSLHSIEAHLLQYQTLLHDFEKSVAFVKETPNPAMEDSGNRSITEELMQRECKNLLSEVDRLHRRCEMFISRLKNAIDLAFATLNIEDSRQTHRLTRATLRDSAAMKLISYLTMVFLPASLTASVFGMNVREIAPGTLETITRYVWVTLTLTSITTWIVIALQSYSTIHKPGASMWQRAAWPAFFLSHKITEYSESLWIKDKNTSPQENNTSLGAIRETGGNFSTLMFDDAIFEEHAIGG